MRAGIVVTVTRTDRRRLEAIVADRNAPQKRSGDGRRDSWPGCRRAHSRQDAQARQATASRHRRAAGGRSDARPATGRCPLIRSVSAGTEPRYGTCCMFTPVIILNISPATCPALPIPGDAMLSLSGWALAKVISSGTVFTGKELLTFRA